jgi:4-amino-4-deoxy-L-arabinose transferase-like glycosyltransferase
VSTPTTARGCPGADVEARHRWVVPGAAAAAFLLRLPGIGGPLSSDEAGFTLVARAWDPEPGSVYGPYFVDRSPIVIAVFRAGDLLGTPWAVRLLGALAAAATVLLVARAARVIGTESGARWSAVVVAALVANPIIDPISVKGELLALPLISGSVLAALCAVRTATRHPSLLAAVAGASGMLAVGLKQNLVGGLVFATVVFAVSWLGGSLDGRRLLRLASVLVVGALLPVAAVTAWAVAAGVRPSVLWYTVYGFRSDAADVLSLDPGGAAYERLVVLVGAAVGAGILAVVAAFAIHLRGRWQEDRPATAAVGAVLLVDLVALSLGGSFWRDYLFPLIPTVGLAVALLARHRDRPGVRVRWIVGAAVASTLAALVAWQGMAAAQGLPDTHGDVGRSIGASSRPGDSLVVFGGRAEIQLAAGLPSPYRHLWSLPMRTLDPEYRALAEVLTGPEAPTWLVEWWPFDLWSEDGGRRLEQVVDEHYVLHADCDGKEIHLRRGLSRPVPDCG